jgi:hypothetical protein
MVTFGLETRRAWAGPLTTTRPCVRAHSRPTWSCRSARLAGIGRCGEAEAAWFLERRRRCERDRGRDHYRDGPRLVRGVPASPLGTADRRRPGMGATRHGSALAHPARPDADDPRYSSPRRPPTPPSAICFAASAASAALRVRQALGTTPPKRSRRCRLDRNLPLHGRAASDYLELDLAGKQGGPDGGCDATRPR